MAGSNDHQQVRCPNGACPSAQNGGRVLFTTSRGITTVHQRIRAGQEVKVAVLGMPVSAVCPSCGSHWINPDLVAFDGVGALIERTIHAAAERVNVQLEAGDEAQERKPRDGLRSAA